LIGKLEAICRGFNFKLLVPIVISGFNHRGQAVVDNYAAGDISVWLKLSFLIIQSFYPPVEAGGNLKIICRYNPGLTCGTDRVEILRPAPKVRLGWEIGMFIICKMEYCCFQQSNPGNPLIL
jgi:hypothetical protein